MEDKYKGGVGALKGKHDGTVPILRAVVWHVGGRVSMHMLRKLALGTPQQHEILGRLNMQVGQEGLFIGVIGSGPMFAAAPIFGVDGKMRYRMERCVCQKDVEQQRHGRLSWACSTTVHTYSRYAAQNVRSEMHLPPSFPCVVRGNQHKDVSINSYGKRPTMA